MLQKFYKFWHYFCLSLICVVSKSRVVKKSFAVMFGFLSWVDDDLRGYSVSVIAIGFSFFCGLFLTLCMFISSFLVSASSVGFGIFAYGSWTYPVLKKSVSPILALYSMPWLLTLCAFFFSAYWTNYSNVWNSYFLFGYAESWWSRSCRVWDFFYGFENYIDFWIFGLSKFIWYELRQSEFFIFELTL